MQVPLPRARYRQERGGVGGRDFLMQARGRASLFFRAVSRSAQHSRLLFLPIGHTLFRQQHRLPVFHLLFPGASLGQPFTVSDGFCFFRRRPRDNRLRSWGKNRTATMRGREREVRMIGIAALLYFVLQMGRVNFLRL